MPAPTRTRTGSCASAADTTQPASAKTTAARVGAGRIGAAGFGRLLTHEGLDHVAYYLETPRMGHIRHDLARCFELHRNLQETGAMLPGLDPDSFAGG